jgi:hypothetical protein
MVAGHFATGLALFGWQRDRSLVSFVLLVMGSMLADILWTVLTPLGLEGGYSLGSQEFHQPRLTYSHSVVTTLGWTVLWGGVCYIITRVRGGVDPGRMGLFGALTVLTHWVLGDAPFAHSFFLAPGASNLPMLHLYRYPIVAFVIELVAVGALWALFMRSVRKPGVPLGNTPYAMLLSLLLLTVMIFLPSFEHRPAVHLDAQPTAILGYLFIILVELALLSGMYRMLARRLSGAAAAPA